MMLRLADVWMVAVSGMSLVWNTGRAARLLAARNATTMIPPGWHLGRPIDRRRIDRELEQISAGGPTEVPPTPAGAHPPAEPLREPSPDALRHAADLAWKDTPGKQLDELVDVDEEWRNRPARTAEQQAAHERTSERVAHVLGWEQ